MAGAKAQRLYKHQVYVLITLSNETIVSTYNRKEDNRDDSIEEEAKLMPEKREDASFVCMCTLASLSGVKTCTHYPNCDA